MNSSRKSNRTFQIAYQVATSHSPALPRTVTRRSRGPAAVMVPRAAKTRKASTRWARLQARRLRYVPDLASYHRLFPTGSGGKLPP
jgi:hypothetical protein